MITILKGVQWTREDEAHLRFVDPEEMKAVMAENKLQREESKWGESKKLQLSRTANIPWSLYAIPHFKERYFKCGNSEKTGEMRKVLLDRLSSLRASKKR